MNYDPNAQPSQPQWQPSQQLGQPWQPQPDPWQTTPWSPQTGQPPSTWYPPTQPGQQWTPPPPTYPQYPQPGQMYTPPPSYVPSPPPRVMKPYSQGVLWWLIGFYALFWFFCLTGHNVSSVYSFGTSICLGIIVSVLILDARGLISLQGTIKTNSTKTLCSLLALFTFPLWLGGYFAMTVRAYQRPPLKNAPVRRKATLALCIGTGVTLFAFMASNVTPATTSQIASTANSRATAVTAPATAAPTHTAATKKPVLTPTPGPAPQSVPAMQPTPTPKPAAVAPPQPTPTQPPTGPTYNTDPNGGQLVYNPPADFCDNHACVSTFWTATRGYVVECANSVYSHSGGVSGACSRDGGVAATLYQH